MSTKLTITTYDTTLEALLSRQVQRAGLDLRDPFQNARPCFQWQMPTCDMEHECTQPVTHIGNKGYVYCTEHAVTRRESGYERCRKMTHAEMLTILSGKPLTKY